MTTVAKKYAREASSFAHPPAKEDDEVKAPVILMVSGGADSSALLLMAATSKLNIDDGRGRARIAKERLHVLHINHELRGLAAKEDAELVAYLANSLGIPCTVVSKDVAALAAKVPGASFESMAREIRYAEANNLANKLSQEFGTPRKAARILTAHTADDRVETFFINAIRGTGTTGLSSIPYRRNRIVRPLLDKTHRELCDYLLLHHCVWAEDATNEDTAYLRNFVRKKIVPLAKEKNPHLSTTLSATCDILGDEDSYLAGVAAKGYRRILVRADEGMRLLDAKKLAATEVAIARRIVRQALLDLEPQARLEVHHITRILEIVAHGKGSLNVTFGMEARIDHGTLRLTARRAPAKSHHFQATWLPIPGKISLGSVALSAERITLSAADDPVALARGIAYKTHQNAALLDEDKIANLTQNGSLWVSPPEKGEVLCPLGMHGQAKKLSDLLSDTHVPQALRHTIPIVHISPGKEIVWVAGMRIDERFCLEASSRHALLLRLTKS